MKIPYITVTVDEPGPHARAMLEKRRRLGAMGDVEPHLRTEGERHELLPSLEAMSERLCQTVPFIITCLRDAGLTVVQLDPAAREIAPIPSRETLIELMCAAWWPRNPSLVMRSKMIAVLDALIVAGAVRT